MVAPAIIAAGITAAASLGGGFMSAQGAASANAANAAMNAQNAQWSRDQWNQQQTFQNNVNVANWAFQDKVNQENFAFAREQTQVGQDFAREQMGFQEQMSSSAYQRAMADMRKAGLNPILAYSQGGASTPGGAAGSPMAASGQSTGGSAAHGEAPENKFAMGNSQAEFGRALGNMASSAVDAYKQTEQAGQVRDQRDYLTGPQTDQTKKTTEHIGYNIEKTAAETYTEFERARLLKEEQSKARAHTAAAYASAGLDEKQIEMMNKYEKKEGPDTLERILRMLQGRMEGKGEPWTAPRDLDKKISPPNWDFGDWMRSGGPKALDRKISP